MEPIKRIIVGFVLLTLTGAYLLQKEPTDTITDIGIFVVASLILLAYTLSTTQKIETEAKEEMQVFLQQAPHWMNVLTPGKIYLLSSVFKTHDDQKLAGAAIEQMEPFKIIVFEMDSLFTSQYELKQGDSFVIFDNWEIRKVVPKE